MLNIKNITFRYSDVYDKIVELIYISNILDKYAKKYDGRAQFSTYLSNAAANKLIDENDHNKKFVSLEVENDEGETNYITDIEGIGNESPEDIYTNQSKSVSLLTEFLELILHNGTYLSKKQKNPDLQTVGFEKK